MSFSLHRLTPLVLFALGLQTPLWATTYNVTSADDFDSLPSPLAAGDEVIIQDGTYDDVGRTLTAAGTVEDPVLMRAANPGKVFFSGGTQFSLKGSHMIISGLAFDGDTAAGGPKYSSGIFRLNADSSDFTLRDCLFRNFDTGVSSSGAFWIQINGYRHTIEYCSFIGKDSEDPILNIIPNEDEDLSGFPSKDIPRRHLIRHCYLADRTNIGLNGYEAIRIGESKYQMYDMSTVVEYCLFKRAIYGPDINNYEPEVISSKSRNNIFRYNTFLENKGGLVLRHGDDCTIDGNYFFGESGSSMGAGIRIIGLRHIIRNNYLQDIDGTDLRAAICLMKGSGEFPEDSTSNGYESPGNARIFHNTIVNCNQPFALGATTSSSGTTAPKNVEIRNNAIQSADSDGDVIDFNSDNGWAISQISFSDNQAYHPLGSYGTVPASGFTTGTPVDLGLDPTLGYQIPQPGSPLINAAADTSPATSHDIQARLRNNAPHDAGCLDTTGTGSSYNRPLAKADVGPVFDGRTDPNRVPSLLDQPSSQSIFEGDAVSFSVTVEDSSGVSYQWNLNELPISGATTDTLSLPSAELSDAGVYTVVLTNASGRTISFPSDLTVAPAAPSITSNPASQLASVGGSATFNVEVEGIAPFTYQWKKGSDPIPGETDADLTLSDVQATDAGEYSVVVTNPHGTATSENAALSVLAGTLLLSDDFEDGDRSNQDLPDSAKWQASSGSISIQSGTLSIPAGRHGLAFFKDSGTQSLDVGEELVASFTLNFSSVGNASGGIRFGLFNSNGISRPSDPSNSAFSAYDGYITTTTASYPDSNENESGSIVFRQRNPGVGSKLISTVGSGNYSTLASSPSTSQGFVAGVDYTATFIAARIGDGTIKLTVDITGGALSNYRYEAETSASPVTAFDGFAVLSTSTNGSSYTIDNATVIHRATPSALGNWRFTHFGTTEGVGPAANTADPDHDELENLLEYLLGLDPKLPDAAGALTSGIAEVEGQDYLTLSFTRDLSATGASLSVQAGPDLSLTEAIDPDGPNQVSSSISDDLETLTIRDNSPVSSAERRFMQLFATEP